MELLWREEDESTSEVDSGRVLDIRSKAVMGVINCTPDSFFPASRYDSALAACREAQKMVARGAKIIDIGGQSTRPGSDFVEPNEECRRVLPLIEQLRAVSNVTISIDTMQVEVAERALDAGADLINDVSALSNSSMRALVAERCVPVVLMHMRGTPKTMQRAPYYDAVVEEVADELKRAIDQALAAGIAEKKIIIDPGIGFGKRTQDNLLIIRELSSFRQLGRPILVGLSHKSFLGNVIGERPVGDRWAATIAGGCLALASGADIIRVHDVDSAIDTVRLVEAVARGAVE